MIARYVHVSFSFTGEAPIEALEKTFGSALDWIRYDYQGWILYTTTALEVWRDRIRNTQGVRTSDSFFLCDFSKDHYSGYMHEEVWTFLSKNRSK